MNISRFIPAVLFPSVLIPAVSSSLMLCLSVDVLADPVYAEDFDTDLPPPREGVDTSLVTGMWLLKFKDVGIYKRYDEDGNSTKTEVVTTGWVYDLIEPTILRDDNYEVIEEDHTQPRFLSLNCLPFDNQDGRTNYPGQWTNAQYKATNAYYNHIQKEETITGYLTVTHLGGGNISGYGRYTQHPAGFAGRFNQDNLISHELTMSGVKISNNASHDDNPDLESDFSTCGGAVLIETSIEGETPTLNTEVLGGFIGEEESITSPPYFEDYNFRVKTLNKNDAGNSEKVTSLTFN